MKHLFSILIICTFSLNAADYAGYSGSFLRMGTSARAMAMGSGFTAELDRGFTAYHNPASIAFLEKRQASFTYHSLTLDRKFIASSFALHLPPTAGLGVAWVSAGVDGIDGRTLAGEATSTLSTSEDAFYISFAQRLQPWVSLGINIKILYNQLPMNESDLAGKGTGFDIGIMLRPGKRMTIGFMVQDLNSYYQWNTSSVFEEEGRVYRDVFPSIFRAGITYKKRKLYFTGDAGIIAGEKSDGSYGHLGQSIRAGVEYTYRKNYFFRGGYGNGRIGVGGGMNFSFIKKNDAFLDYAMIAELPAGVAHIITYAFHF
ncbi:MAG: PorV/PorQ family protein [Candidatus Marinimicrobia bacterium]|jgi:hypothetical protein|nr:PorV/PorQ family protein [Candidatus Neomarinimicrobiota bacterium]